MTEMDALDRLIAREVIQASAPPRPVDDAAIFTAITATQSPKWRFGSMFSAAKFVVAGAIVALFGGLLLAGLLVTPRGEDMAPAAVSPFPTTDGLLSGMVTEEVEPGVHRVDSDGIRPLSRPLGTDLPDYDIHRGMEGSVAAGFDGSVWWFDQDGFFRLGEPEVYGWRDDRQDTFFLTQGIRSDSLTIDLEVGLDGTVWLARHGLDAVQSDDDTSVWEDEISSFDGESWSVHQPMSDGQILGVEVRQDGEVWAAWLVGNWIHVARLGDAGWETLPDTYGDGYADLVVGGTGGDGVWLMPGVAQLLQRHDGNGTDGSNWEYQTTPAAGYEMRADAGPDGSLWVRLDPGCTAGPPGSGGCSHSRSDILARFDGTDWEVFDASDGIPLSGDHSMRFRGFFEAAPNGSIWFNPTVSEEEFIDTDCDGVANFDGRAVTRYLRGTCIYAMDVAPDGAVWVQSGYPGDDDPQPIHTYVITPEAVAGTE